VPLHISSLFHHGIRSATPLIAPPAVATLFVGEIFYETVKPADLSKTERESVVLSLSFDQQHVTGLAAVAFLNELRTLIENFDLARTHPLMTNSTPYRVISDRIG